MVIKRKHFYTWIKHVDTARAKLRTVMGIVLLFVLMILPPAFADYAEGDYLHHLWASEAESQRNQEAYNALYNSDRNAVRFCAIAYSLSTDKWGYSWGKHNQEEAEQEAIKNCAASDAKILCWSKGNWYCALADGPDSYGAAPGQTPAIARAEALKLANGHGQGNRVVLLVGGNPPIVKLGESAEQQGGPSGPSSKSFGLDLLNNGPRPRH